MSIVQLFESAKQWVRKDKWRVLALAALLIILGAGCIRDAYLLSQHNVAVGIDGYYYVLQIDTLKNEHRLYFHTRTPFVLYGLGVINHFTNGSVAAVKAGAVLLHALLSLGIFALILSTTRNHWLSVLGAGLALISGLHLYMIVEFISSLGALTFLVWSVWAAVRWARTRKPAWLILLVVLLAAAVFSHQLALAVAIIVAVSLLLFRGLVSFRSHGKYGFAALIAVIAIYFAPALAKAQSVIAIPESLLPELTAVPQWPIAYDHLPETLILAVFASLALALLLGPLRPWAGTIVGSLVGSVAIWSLLVTLNPFLNGTNGWTGTVGRLRGLAYIQVALIIPGVIWLALSVRPKIVPYLLAVLPAFAILTTLWASPLGLQSEYLLRRARLAQRLPYLKGAVPSDSIIIAAHGDQFLVSSALGIASQRAAPASTRPTTYWLLDAPKDQMTRVDSVRVAEHPTSKTILVDGQALGSYLQSAPDIERRTLLIYNRHLSIAYNQGGPGSPLGPAELR